MADASTPSDLPGETGLSSPSAVAVDGAGRVLIADTGHEVIETLEDGRLHVVAGTGPGFGGLGDGGRATLADLSAPSDVVAMPDGGFLVVDQGHQRVRRVAPDGTIATVAGTGVRSFAGDGGPAVRAGLNLPVSAALAADGTVLIADSGNNRVRAIGPDGIIRTVAGGSDAGSAGDGGPAAAALLDRPSGVASFNGGVLIADSGNGRLRVVDAAGTISSWPPAFRNPTGLVVLADGRPVVADPAAGSVAVIGADAAPGTNIVAPAAPFTISFKPRLRRLMRTLRFTVNSDARITLAAKQRGRWVQLGSVTAKSGPGSIELAPRAIRRLGRRGFVVLRLRAVRADGRTVQSAAKVRLG